MQSLRAGRLTLRGHLRALSIGLSLVILVVLGGFEAYVLTEGFTWDLFGDYFFFRSIAERWVDTGALYFPHQLAGPYPNQLQVDNLYPPHALLLFLPLLVVPAPLWWIVPVGITLYVLWWLRPAWWSWPILALLAIWPKTVVALLWGNTDLWVIAFIAAGIRWGWPAILVSIKPIFLPFALVGARSRSFWVLAAALGALGLMMLPLWVEYVGVVRNLSIPAEYSLRAVPSFFLPIAAWLVRQPRAAPLAATTDPLPADAEAGSIQVAADRP